MTSPAGSMGSEYLQLYPDGISDALTCGDFTPCNEWVLDVDGEIDEMHGRPQHIIDKTTGRKFINITETELRLTCCCCLFLTPPLQAVGILGNSSLRFIRCISCADCEDDSDVDSKFSCLKVKKQDTTAKKINGFFGNLIGCIKPILIFPALIFTSIYATCKPRDASKLYTNLERWGYGMPVFSFGYASDNEVDEEKKKSHA